MKELVITNAEKYKKPVYEHLLYDTKDKPDGLKSYRLHSDVYLLFNQQRLNTLGNDTARKVVESFQNHETSNSFPNVSDMDLLNTIVPRHFQSTSELKKVSNSIESATKTLIDSAKRQQEFNQKQKEFDDELKSFKETIKNVQKQ